MSILVTGIEIPKEGHITVHICADGTVYEPTSSANVWYKVATAVPIPPHGRLIDADALTQRIEYEQHHHPHTDGLAKQHHVAEYGHFLRAIFDADTIIPAESENKE